MDYENTEEGQLGAEFNEDDRSWWCNEAGGLVYGEDEELNIRYEYGRK